MSDALKKDVLRSRSIIVEVLKIMPAFKPAQLHSAGPTRFRRGCPLVVQETIASTSGYFYVCRMVMRRVFSCCSSPCEGGRLAPCMLSIEANRVSPHLGSGLFLQQLSLASHFRLAVRLDIAHHGHRFGCPSLLTPFSLVAGCVGFFLPCRLVLESAKSITF